MDGQLPAVGRRAGRKITAVSDGDVDMPRLRLFIVLLGLMLLTAPLPVFSQNCALCYTQAASAGARMIQALRSGILVLIIPPTLMTVGFGFVAYQKRNQFRDGEITEESDRNWHEIK